MRLLWLLVLVSLTAEANDHRGRFERFCSRTAQGRSNRGFACEDAAFFEFAPTSGAGMGAVCACTTPTGAKGETLTYTRASNGTCTKTATGGLATTGIANGDIVVCSTNQPRVEYDEAGYLGLLVESARTNIILRSQEIENAAWTWGGTYTPTITANYATAPDGTATADRVQIQATGSGEAARGYQSALTAGSTYVCSGYLRGVSGSGQIDTIVDGSGSGFQCSTASFVSTSWTRFVMPAKAVTVGVGSLLIGNDSRAITCSNGTRTAQDVLIWGVQCEATGTATYATSYIPTVGSTVARALDSASLAVASFSSSAGMSWGSNVVHPSGNGGSVWGSSVALIQDATNRTQLYRANTNVQNCDYFSTAGNRSSGPVIAAYVAGQNYRQSCAYSGAGASSTISGYRDGVLTATSATGTTGAITITSLFPGALGAATSNSPADGIVSRVCLDPSLTRCIQ